MNLRGPQEYPNTPEKIVGHVSPEEGDIWKRVFTSDNIDLGDSFVKFVQSPETNTAKTLTDKIDNINTRAGKFPGDLQYKYSVDAVGRKLWSSMSNTIKSVFGLSTEQPSTPEEIVADTEAKKDSIEFLQKGINSTRSNDRWKKALHYGVAAIVATAFAASAVGAGFTPIGLLFFAGAGASAMSVWFSRNLFKKREWSRKAGEKVVEITTAKMQADEEARVVVQPQAQVDRAPVAVEPAQAVLQRSDDEVVARRAFREERDKKDLKEAFGDAEGAKIIRKKNEKSGRIKVTIDDSERIRQGKAPLDPRVKEITEKHLEEIFNRKFNKGNKGGTYNKAKGQLFAA